MKNFLKLTCSILVVSVVISGDAYSNLFSDLADKAKSTLGSAKKGLTDSASELKKQATEKFNTTKTSALEHIDDAKTKATGLLDSAKEKKDAVKKAGSDALSSVKEAANSVIDPKSDSKSKTESEKESKKDSKEASKEETAVEADDIQSLDEDLAKLGIDLGDTDAADDADLLATEKEEQGDKDNSKLNAPRLSQNNVIEQKAAEEPDAEAAEGIESIFSAEVIAKVDNIFSGINPMSSGLLLDLSNKELTDEELAYIATVKFPLLSEQGVEKITLKVSQNAFTSVGLKILLDSLKAAPKLVSMIDCSGNKIGDEGVVAIAEALKNIPLLHTILLSDCGITGNGVLELLSSIVELKDYPYQGLDLSKNSIDPSFTPLIIEKLQAIRDDSFGDGINLKETGMQLPEGTNLPDIIMIG